MSGRVKRQKQSHTPTRVGNERAPVLLPKEQERSLEPSNITENNSWRKCVNATTVSYQKDKSKKTGPTTMYTVRLTIVSNGSFQHRLLERSHADFEACFRSLEASHAGNTGALFGGKGFPVCPDKKTQTATAKLGSGRRGQREILRRQFDEFVQFAARIDPLPPEISAFLSMEAEPYSEAAHVSGHRSGSGGPARATLEEKLRCEAARGAEADPLRGAVAASEAERAGLLQLLGSVQAERVEAHLWSGDSLGEYCRRFLRARQGHVGKAKAMLDADLVWREEHRWKEQVERSWKVEGRGVDENAEKRVLGPLSVLGLSEEECTEMLPLWHQGFSKDGRPVSIQVYGAVRLNKLLAATTLDKVCAFQVHQTEALVRACGARGQNQWLIIVDAAGWDPSNLVRRAAFTWAKHMNSVDACHNPERLGAMLIINAPQVVYTFYSMLSYLLDEATAQKIRIFTTRDTWLPVLLGLIDASELPPEYGGTGANYLHRSLTDSEYQSVLGKVASDRTTSKGC